MVAALICTLTGSKWHDNSNCKQNESSSVNPSVDLTSSHSCKNNTPNDEKSHS